MESNSMAEAGLFLLEEAAVRFQFNRTNRPIERFGLAREFGMSDGFWHDVLRNSDKVRREHPTSAEWMLTNREHGRRLADLAENAG